MSLSLSNACLSSVAYWDGNKIDLDAAVVMPDHVHMIFRIVGQTSSLSSILHGIKSYSANEVNKILKRRGPLWLDESFDHIIRHGREWEEKVEYIRQNAVKKGLAQKPEDYKWLWTRSDRQDACPTVEFEVFEPKSEKEVHDGTVTRAKATCLCCGTVLPPERVRAQLSEQRGGADVLFDATGRRKGGARLLAVVTLKPREQGRHYRLPTERDYQAVWKAQKRVARILEEWESGSSFQPDRTGKMPVPHKMPVPQKGLCPVPDETLPPIGTLGFRVQRYGMLHWGDLFTARQNLALVTLARLVRDLPPSTPEPVRLGMALVVNRMADGDSSLSSWLSSREEVKHAFARQALPIVWDFAEVDLKSEATRSWSGALDWVARVIEAWPPSPTGQVQLADATEHPLPDDAATVWFTDPPYYDAVPYADLSDFFFVRLKRALAGWKPAIPFLRDPFDPANPLVPKAREAVQNERSETQDGRPKDRAFYEDVMARAFAEGRRVLREDGVGSVVFAHKTTEGWEALLSGMIRGGWTITGSWPIATEMGSRLRARESAALATSVHLVCRPRVGQASSLSDQQDAGPTGDWASVLRELPSRVGDWMERLQAEGIRGADLVFACIGPALEIFSRYSKVETADGREVKLAEFLEKVWEVVGRTALEQVLGCGSGFQPDMTGKMPVTPQGGLEEDARLTALFLWTLQSTNGEKNNDGDTEDTEEEGEDEDEHGQDARATGKAKGYSLVFDVVRRFAQPLGIDLPKWEGRVIETKKGVVRLLPVSDRAKQLFGKEGAHAIAERLEDAATKGIPQLPLFAQEGDEGAARRRSRRPKEVKEVSDEELNSKGEPTTLDRVHMAMLLQAAGRANALRALLRVEQERGPEFLRLANALSALYPKSSEEKRLLDAMLLAVPR